MSTLLRLRSMHALFGRVAGGAVVGAGIVAIGCCALDSCEHQHASCEGKAKALRRQTSEGVRRRDLVRCQGSEAQMLQNYDLSGALGRGSFGSVRKAIHKATSLVRAIKTVQMKGDDANSTAEWDRMLTEVEALMDLDHPNIVRLYEYYRTPDALYLVEEYCSGGTLEQRLEKAGGRFSPQQSAVTLREMLRGLMCCHAHGFAHRDLKPDNFCYGSQDPSASLKMIDFGLSLAAGSSPAAPLAYVEAAGTLEYTAPETLPQRDASGKLTRAARYHQAADIWAAGAILFLMLTGEP